MTRSELSVGAPAADLRAAAVSATIIITVCYVTLLPYPYMGGKGLAGIPLPRLLPLVAGMLLVCSAGYGYLKRRAENRPPGILVIPVLAMVGVQSLGAVASLEPAASLAKTGFYAVTGVAFFFAARSLSRSNREAVIRAVLVFSAMAGAVSAAEFFVGRSPLFHESYVANDPYYLYPQLFGRSFGTLGHPVFMGAIFVLGIPCGLHVMATAGRLRWKVLAGMLLAATVLGLFFTFTRSAYLAAAAAALVFFRDRISLKSALMVLAVLALLAGLAATSAKVRDVVSRRNPIKEYVQEYKKAHRLRALGVVARVMKDAPLLGVGVGNYRALYERYRLEKGDTRATYATPDNMYLVTLAESGLMGLGLFLYILYAAYKLFRTGVAGEGGADSGMMLMGLSMLAGFSIAMFFFDALYVEPVRILFWTLMGATAGEP